MGHMQAVLALGLVVLLIGTFAASLHVVLRGSSPPPRNHHDEWTDLRLTQPSGFADLPPRDDGPNYVNGPVTVDWNVPNPDPFDLDRDHNGVGCQTADWRAPSP